MQDSCFKVSDRRHKNLPLAIVSLAFASITLSVSPARSQGTLEQRITCMSDGFKYCAKHIPDIPAITTCMETNYDRLTPACQMQFGPDFKKKRHRGH